MCGLKGPSRQVGPRRGASASWMGAASWNAPNKTGIGFGVRTAGLALNSVGMSGSWWYR